MTASDEPIEHVPTQRVGTPPDHGEPDPRAPTGVTGRYDLVVVANRLPVDRVVHEDGSTSWTRSPGGLVTALEPVMHDMRGAWVGWTGGPDDPLQPFTHEETYLVPVELSAQEIEQFYEGFSNGTLWPLYRRTSSPPRPSTGTGGRSTAG